MDSRSLYDSLELFAQTEEQEQLRSMRQRISPLLQWAILLIIVDHPPLVVV